MKKIRNNKISFIIIICILICIFITINLLMQTGWSKYIDFSKASNYGGLLAGILTFFSALLLYLTLKHQINSSAKSAFESRFFELIKYHRENVSEMKYSNSILNINNKCDYKGKIVFEKIFQEIEDAIKYISPLFENIDPTSLYNSNNKKENYDLFINNKNIDIVKLNLYNVAYLTVFFGTTKKGICILYNILSKNYSDEFCMQVLNFLKEKDNSSFLFIFKNLISKDKKKLYSGHQIWLGHYFRNLFQAVNYVNDSSLFNYNEKYNYVKFLRAQLSTYEQAILFFNSLSFLGRKWEYHIENESKIDKHLITKYNMITNIPSEFISTKRILKDFYPLVEYEFENEKIPQKEKLKKEYK